MVLVTVAAVVLAGVALTIWQVTRGGTETQQQALVPRAPETTRKPTKATKTPAFLSMADVVASVEGGVAKISGGGSTGTGFLIADGVLATSAHVIEETFLSDIRVQFPKRGPRQEGVTAILHKDNARDLCLLRVSKGQPPLRLAKSQRFRRGEEVLLIGNPGVGDYAVLENAVTQGLLSAITTIEGRRFYQISASVNPGNSGGPVLNRKGEVVCVATLRAGGVEGIAFGIPADDVRTALWPAVATSSKDTRAAEAQHNAQVVFLRMAQFGSAYLVGMYVNVVAMEKAMAVGMDPSAALWTANAAYAPYLGEARRRWGDYLSPQCQRAISDQGLDARVQRLFRELRTCTDDLRDYVDDPRGRIGRYIASYKHFRGTFASIVSRLDHELEVSKDLVANLPEDR